MELVNFLLLLEVQYTYFSGAFFAIRLSVIFLQEALQGVVILGALITVFALIILNGILFKER
jgi:hypothetical protein